MHKKEGSCDLRNKNIKNIHSSYSFRIYYEFFNTEGYFAGVQSSSSAWQSAASLRLSEYR